MYWDANNLYGWAMSQILPIDGFKWKKNRSKFNEEFMKNYDEDSVKGYILKVDVEYSKGFTTSKRLRNLQNDLPFLTEKNED